MRIQHNLAALNAYRQLGNNNSALSKNLEKLSSGYRINRAGDDAAGHPGEHRSKASKQRRKMQTTASPLCRQQKAR